MNYCVVVELKNILIHSEDSFRTFCTDCVTCCHKFQNVDSWHNRKEPRWHQLNAWFLRWGAGIAHSV